MSQKQFRDWHWKGFQQQIRGWQPVRFSDTLTVPGVHDCHRVSVESEKLRLIEQLDAFYVIHLRLGMIDTQVSTFMCILETVKSWV